MFKKDFKFCLALLLLVSISGQAQLPAFPGAEGYGALATGGRGGDVYHVTNLNNDGPGSLRNGLDSASGPRTIVFDISGTIELTTYLSVHTDNLTIAGQTAPDMGICITGYGLGVGANQVVLRHLRFRPGDKYLAPHDEGGFTEDALTLGGKNVIADHISTSWAVDENLSCATSFDSVTIQYCLIAEGLHQTHYYHGEYVPDHPGHSMGSLIKVRGTDAAASLHHNLWAHNNNRNPAVGSYDSTEYVQVDVRNNVMYNCRYFGYSSGASRRVDLNYVSNYLIAGPSTSSSGRHRAFKANEPNNVHIYQFGNLFDYDLDTTRDGHDTGWGMFDGVWISHQQEFFMPKVETLPTHQAYEMVRSQVGALPYRRDPVDQRIIADLVNGTGKIIDSQEEVGGYPEIPTVTRADDWDTDQDGMPDIWEDERGLDRSDPEDRNDDDDGDGYTNLEAYLNNLGTASGVFKDQAHRLGEFELTAFPNPFNPVTRIIYIVPKRAPVKVSLYNSLGQQLMVLIDDVKAAGTYEFMLANTGLTSGLYFIRMVAGNSIVTKKLSLLR